MERRGFIGALGSFVGAAALGQRVSLPFVSPPEPRLVLDDLAGLVYATEELLRDSAIDFPALLSRALGDYLVERRLVEGTD